MRSIHRALLLLPVAIASAGAQQLPDSLAGVVPIAVSLRDSVLRSSLGGATTRAARGFAIGTVESKHGALNDAVSLPLALQARLAGVSISQTDGVIGSSAQLWLRGPTSAVLNEPLLIIDGVRTHGANPSRMFEDRGIPSRLEDIDMETVERVEVLRGLAASAIYGIGASKGVILVTTKRGGQGTPRWTAFAESGPLIEPTAFPANFGTLGVSTSTGEPVDDCTLSRQAAGACTPTVRRSWNPLESASPFRTGWTNGGGLSVSGSEAGVAYHAAASHDRANGVYATDRSHATSGRVSLAVSPLAEVDVRLTAAHRIDRLSHPAESVIGAGLFGESIDDPANRGYAGGGLRALTRDARAEDVDRTTVGLEARWRVRERVETGIIIGYDRLHVATNLRVRRPQFTFPEPSTDSVTSVEMTADVPQTRSAAADATVSYGLRGLTARSTIGIQYIRDDDHGATLAELTSDDGSTATNESTYHFERASGGIYARQRLAWGDRVFVGGSLRADRLMGAARDLDAIISTSVDASWLALDAGRAATPGWLDVLRLRAAYGRGGDHAVGAVGSWSGGGAGGSAPRSSERGAELEVGADASLHSNRLNVGLTWSRASTERGLVTLPSFGTTVLANVAGVSSSGVEATVDAMLLAVGPLRWEMGLVFSAYRSSFESLDAPAFISDNRTIITEGAALGEYWLAPYAYADPYADGRIAPSEVTVLSDEYGPAGVAHPDYEAGLRTGLSLGSRVHVAALLDRRSGASRLDRIASVRCRVRCSEQHDPATSLERQSRAVAAQAGTPVGYLEDASYTRLREVRATLSLPERIARFGGAAGARLTVTGRNLHTWTRYGGIDPELPDPAGAFIFAPGSYLQPPLRSFVARLDVQW